MNVTEIRNEEENIKYLRATFGLMEDKNYEIKGLENQVFQISKLIKEFGEFIKVQIRLDEVYIYYHLQDNQQDLLDIMKSNQLEDLIEMDPNI